MQFKDTTATRKIFQLKKRIRAVSGGTSASKTISILIWCIDYAQTVKGELISVVSESYPHLEDGAMRDFMNIMKSQGYWRDANWHSTKHEYTFGTGTVIEFVSVDTYGKAHGPRRDVLFVNEANNLSYNIVDQLITRTRKIVWLDWNPSEEFWFYTEMLPNRTDVDFITLTYLDNEALDTVTVSEIESHRNNKNWWTVYGLGQLGAVEGRIYKDWAIIDEIPHEARLERRGLDFGYSHDSAALVDIYYYNGGYVWDQRLYQLGMFNRQLADFIKNLDLPQTLIKADSAEPKAIDEIRSFGINIQPVEKGADSVKNGISYIQAQRISVTKSSVDLIREYRGYMWKTDRDGRILPIPEDGKDDCLDAGRYGMEKLMAPPVRRKIVGYTGGDPTTGFGRRPVYDDPLLP
ncbi:MAG: terminase [Blastocatellia bacterium]|nr:terminase [Blastocatellia bacterium]